MNRNIIKSIIFAAVAVAAGGAWAYTYGAEYANGYTWYYYIDGGTAKIYKEDWYGSGTTAISPLPTGAVTIPATLGGKPVTSIGDGAFYDCSGLTSVTIPDSVTSIGNDAFYNCSGLTSVTIGSSVTNIGSSAFYYCRGLRSVTIPNSVTSIGDYAFYYCTNLTSVTIGNGVTRIGQEAFYNCSGLTSVTIPDGVTSIGDYAFYYCTNLTSVTIGNGVTSIDHSMFYGCNALCDTNSIPGVKLIGGWAVGNTGSLSGDLDLTGVRGIGPSAFAGCSGLTSVTIGNGVKSIGYRAFYDCSGLTSVTIPDSVTSIGAWAFEYCSGLTSVTIGNGVTSIGPSAFAGCSGLSSVTIGNGVTSIGPSAFYNCNALYDTNSIPGVKLIDGWAVGNTGSLSGDLDLTGVRGIGSSAFCNCSGLANVMIPDSVTSIGSAAFSGCSGLTSVMMAPARGLRVEEGAFDKCSSLGAVGINDLAAWCEVNFADAAANPLTKAHNLYTTELLKEIVVPEGVGRIGSFAFSGCSNFTKVELPNTVTNIGSEAFFGCSKLANVAIPDSVTSLGSSAFEDCSGLRSVTIGNSVTSIGYRTFKGCSGLTSVTIPGSVTSLGSAAFSGCSGLTSVTIPDGVTSIGAEAFSGCSGLTSVTIPDGVTSIEQRVFYGCKGLTNITIPKGVTSIGYGAFRECSGLTSVTIPDSVTSIGYDAFRDCSGLTGVAIPDSVTSIGDRAFYNCSGLTSVTIPDGVTSIGDSVFRGCSGLTSVTIPDNVTNIGAYAFSGCSRLAGVAIGNGVTNVGSFAFSECRSLEWLIVPAGVEAIGGKAFEGCWSLTTVYYLGNAPSTGGGIYHYTPSTLISYAKAGTIGWQFPNLQALPGTWPITDGADSRSIVNGIPDQVTVSFDAAGGDMDDTSQSVPWVSGFTFGALPVLTRKGYVFDGWFTAAEGGTRVAADTVVTGNAIYYAHWTALWTVTYDLQDGRMEEETEVVVTNGYAVGTLPTPTREGHAFDGWFTAAEGGTRVAADTVVTGNATYYAHWTALWTVTYDLQGGTIGDGQETSVIVTNRCAAGTLPVPTRDGYIFEGWFTAAEGGTLVTAATVVTGNITYYAQWTKNVNPAPTNPDPVIPDPVTPDPEPVAPCYTVLSASDVVAPYKAPKLVTLQGVVYDGCDVVGIVELKLGKVNAKKESGKVSGSVTTLDGKKHAIKALTLTEIDGMSPKAVSLDVKDLGTMSITIGGTRFAGSLGKYHVQSAAVGGNWTKGGAKVYVDTAAAALPAGTQEKLLPAGEPVEAAGGKWKFAKAAGVKWAKPKKGAALPEIYDDESQKGLVVDTSAGKTNLSGLKLTYVPKKGTFKGSFKVYALEGAGKAKKLKKYTVSVSGVVVGGVGYGTAACKRPAAGPWPVTVK